MIATWKTFSILIYFKKLIGILSWIQSSKEQHLFEILIFCNIINVFTVTFDTLQPYNILLTPNFWSCFG